MSQLVAPGPVCHSVDAGPTVRSDRCAPCSVVRLERTREFSKALLSRLTHARRLYDESNNRDEWRGN
eukprot:5908457-Alexandrium_andersonii.AAC.1